MKMQTAARGNGEERLKLDWALADLPLKIESDIESVFKTKDLLIFL